MFNHPLRVASLFGAAIIALVITSGEGHAAGRKSCVLAGGEATMITRGLAEFMANAALKNSMKKMDAAGVGPVSLKCNDPAPLTYCKAQQRACK
jgi:hypothetical protein